MMMVLTPLYVLIVALPFRRSRSRSRLLLLLRWIRHHCAFSTPARIQYINNTNTQHTSPFLQLHSIATLASDSTQRTQNATHTCTLSALDRKFLTFQLAEKALCTAGNTIISLFRTLAEPRRWEYGSFNYRECNFAQLFNEKLDLYQERRERTSPIP